MDFLDIPGRTGGMGTPNRRSDKDRIIFGWQLSLHESDGRESVAAEEITEMRKKSFGRMFLCVGLLLTLWLLVSMTGVQVYTVMSGSMEPTLPVGSLAWVVPADQEQLQEGDVIVYQRGETKIIHRIWKIIPEQKEIITKGDANERADATPVAFGQVQGRMVWHVPWLGYPGIMCRRSTGKTIIAGAVILLLSVGVYAFWGNRSKRKEGLTCVERKDGKILGDYSDFNSGDSLPAHGRACLPDCQGSGGESGCHGGKHYHGRGKVSGAGSIGSGTVS